MNRKINTGPAYIKRQDGVVFEHPTLADALTHVREVRYHVVDNLAHITCEEAAATTYDFGFVCRSVEILDECRLALSRQEAQNLIQHLEPLPQRRPSWKPDLSHIQHRQDPVPGTGKKKNKRKSISPKVFQAFRNHCAALEDAREAEKHGVRITMRAKRKDLRDFDFDPRFRKGSRSWKSCRPHQHK